MKTISCHVVVSLVFPLVLLACGKSPNKKRIQDPLQKPEPQEETPGRDWYNASTAVGGAGIGDAYKLLADARPINDVIVAVIDSGVDIEHEDLKDAIWTNPKEIPNNGIDDDGNGYIDDIHGWNYLVDSEGNTIVEETSEITREMRRLTKLSETQSLSETDSMYFEEVKAAFAQAQAHASEKSRKKYDLLWQQRSDDLEDFSPISTDHPAYGNSDIEDRVGHGTHVAGIIAANRENSVGIKGVAQHAKIMVLRAIPDGDEHDKDIYHAVRYATDNGAKIINMSFGKSFSPYKERVMEAFQYARDHGVLLVHAAGNSAENLDKGFFFPSRSVYQGQNFLDSWLEVGASTQMPDPSRAFFSNYGKLTVDLFAPGQNILSCAPTSKYADASGTSSAAPVVSGVAALVLTYRSGLTASDLRQKIFNSVRTTRLDNTALEFVNLSSSGGVIDATSLFKTP